MTERPTKKTCSTCGKELPATEEFFFPSYLEPRGKNTCKTCHREYAKNTHSLTYRAQLRERATPIAGEQVPFYQSLNSIATALGVSVRIIEHDIFDRNLPVYTFIYNTVGPALALQMEDAEAYIRAQQQNGHPPAVTPERPTASPQADERDAQRCPPAHASGRIDHEMRSGRNLLHVESQQPEVMGSPDLCGCCHTDKGNILAVHDTARHVVAYLCSSCYRAARSFEWEPVRLRAVAQLIETLGVTIDRSRR